MKHFLFLIVAALAASTLSSNLTLGAEEQAGGQEGHGGETIDINGRPRLRDLVDSSVCTWVQASDLTAVSPEYKQIISAIDEVHWYLARTYQEEAEYISVCVTKSALKQIPSEDQDGLTIYEAETKQVAIRLNDMIFVDGSIYKKLSPQDKAYLLFHELTHSFIPKSAVRRGSKVRNFVHAIFENEQTRMSRKRFALQIQRNDVQIAAETTGLLDKYRDSLLRALNSENSEEERLNASIGAVRALDQLVKRDQDKINALKAKVAPQLARLVASGDVTELERFLAKGFDPNSEKISMCFYDNYGTAFNSPVQAQVPLLNFALLRQTPGIFKTLVSNRETNVNELSHYFLSSISVRRRDVLERERSGGFVYDKAVALEGRCWGDRFYTASHLHVTPHQHFGANVQFMAVFPPIVIATFLNDVESAKLLLQRDDLLMNYPIACSDPNVVGKTALHYAASPEMLSLLLSRPDIDLNLADYNGYTPLMSYCATGSEQTLGGLVDLLLLDKRLDVSKITSWSLMQIGAQHPWCLPHLLKHQGLDVNLRHGSMRSTALHLIAPTVHAETLNHIEGLRALVFDPRTDLFAVDADGNTPLSVAKKLSPKAYEEFCVVYRERLGDSAPEECKLKPSPAPTPKPTPEPLPYTPPVPKRRGN